MSQLPDCISMTLSFENVENVVKPPHKPTERKRTKFCETLGTRQNRPHSNPMSKHPIRLTVKVAHGNPPSYLRISETTYRNVPPTKLPAPTYKTSFHIHYQLQSAAKVLLFSDICKSLTGKCVFFCYFCYIYSPPATLRSDCSSLNQLTCPPTQNFEPPSDRPKRKRRKELRLLRQLGSQKRSCANSASCAFFCHPIQP